MSTKIRQVSILVLALLLENHVPDGRVTSSGKVILAVAHLM